VDTLVYIFLSFFSRWVEDIKRVFYSDLFFSAEVQEALDNDWSARVASPTKDSPECHLTTFVHACREMEVSTRSILKYRGARKGLGSQDVDTILYINEALCFRKHISSPRWAGDILNTDRQMSHVVQQVGTIGLDDKLLSMDIASLKQLSHKWDLHRLGMFVDIGCTPQRIFRHCFKLNPHFYTVETWKEDRDEHFGIVYVDQSLGPYTLPQ
jgi:hypothetical protein